MSALVPILKGPELSPQTVSSMKRNLNAIIAGQINSVGEVTLRASQTTTTLTDGNIVAGCHIFFTPETANAQSLGIPWADQTSIPINGPIIGGSITLNHGSSANTDLTFGYVIFV
jgi:propanediol utilization protein